MTGVLTWRYLTEYARRPLNLVLLAVVPVVFVALSAGATQVLIDGAFTPTFDESGGLILTIAWLVAPHHRGSGRLPPHFGPAERMRKRP